MAKPCWSIGGRVSTLHTGRSSFDLNSRLVHRERERERGAEGEEKQVWSGSGLQSEREKEKRAEGSSAQGRAGNYVSGRPFVRLQSSLHNTGLGRSSFTRPRKRDTEEETGEKGEERRGEEKETSGTKEGKEEVREENPDLP